MTRKDYELIAKILWQSVFKHDDKFKYIRLEAVAHRLASAFENNGYKFDRKQWLKACKIDS